MKNSQPYVIECIPEGKNIIFTVDESWDTYYYLDGVTIPIEDDCDLVTNYYNLKGLLIEEYILYGTIQERYFYLSDLYDIRRQEFLSPFNKNCEARANHIGTITYLAEGELLNEDVIKELEYDGELMITFVDNDKVIDKYLLQLN